MTSLIQCDECRRMVPHVHEDWLGVALCPECETAQDNRHKAAQDAEADAMDDREMRACADMEEW